MPNSANTDLTLVVDIGNSNMVCAVYEQDIQKNRYRIKTDPDSTVDDLYSSFEAAMSDYSLREFKYVALGSVVPKMGKIFKAMIQTRSSAKVYEITGLSPLGLRYLIKDPSLVGADLVGNAFAAWKKYHGSTLVVDLGTATTIQLIDKDGLYAGVVIAPGIMTAASHLFEKAALLSNVVLQAPSQLLGNTTRDALLSGIITGHALMLRGFISEIKVNYAQYGPFQTVLSGGLANVIAPMCSTDYIVDQNLTLDGFYLAMKSLIQNESK
ncbi:MAG: type III pantothenate kinase [Candidatus Cloacimonadaceae bacterium]|jgi:type III pantothenate kinase|nr:type III pantothenate kinase [Candidatus Cloacimonadota bacterium]MDY0128472.1 type III pantothenate kinase [Candidatus Cloacimonadaceae bacterium]MCB5254611.1 type III pantothenate kinase [Candidatus Cloacimonadota bacterium]MCK9178745.1 type III pantothenate kinase [Candidatus Cloacimonadota bacterium]MCK9243152.1 type III pantothenate kinase [Candidatus Cloacimonadota bacterium]